MPGGFRTQIRMKHIYHIVFHAMNFFSVCVYGQEGSKIRDMGMLEKQKQVMAETYPGIFTMDEIDSIKKLDEEHSMVSYRKFGRHYEAVVNSDRKDMLLVANCEEIPTGELPEIVRNAFSKSKDGGQAIHDAYIVTTPGSSDFFRIDFSDPENAGILKSVFYTDLGEYHIPPY